MKLQSITQKYKQYDGAMKNYVPTNWTSLKWISSQKDTISQLNREEKENLNIPTISNKI